MFQSILCYLISDTVSNILSYRIIEKNHLLADDPYHTAQLFVLVLPDIDTIDRYTTRINIIKP